MGDVELRWDLPQGWRWARLAQLTSFIGRGRGPKYVEMGGVPVVNQRAVRWHRLDSAHLKYTSREAYDGLPAQLRVKRGDLLWNSTGTGTIGRALVFDGRIEELTADSHVTIVRPTDIDPAFLGYFVETAHVQRLVENAHVGSTNQRELPRSFVQELLVPLPPFEEQTRIVARIDELFAEIAEGEASLVEARQGLEVFRQSIMKAAVTGELSASLVGAGPSPPGGADVESSDTSLPPLPSSWTWQTIGDLGEVGGGVTKHRDREKLPNDAPYLRVANVQKGYLDLTEIKRIGVTDLDRDRCTLAAGDVLIVEGNGSVDQIGRCALWRDEIAECVHQNHIIRVRFATARLAEWCILWLLSPHGRQQIQAVASSTSGLHTLSIAKVKALPIPLPPEEEMAAISALVSQALASTEDVEHQFDDDASDAARLKQSILKAAFEGRLVGQDGRDEPASAVLGRLGQTGRTSAKSSRGAKVSA